MNSFEIRIKMDNGELHSFRIERTTSQEAFSFVVDEQSDWIEHSHEEKVLYIRKDKIASFEVIDISWGLDKVGQKQAEQLAALLKNKF